MLPNELIGYYTRKAMQQQFSNHLLNNVFISIISGVTATTLLYPSDVLRQFLNNQISNKLTFMSAIKKLVS